MWASRRPCWAWRAMKPRSITPGSACRGGRLAWRQERRAETGAIIEHADVKRMLLAQKALPKARWRWSFTARGWWTNHIPAKAMPLPRAKLLLEVLTPIAKSWPSNGAWRRIRWRSRFTAAMATPAISRSNNTGATTGLNMIHEGAHGIQALGPARAQGGDGGRQGPHAARHAHERHDHARNA